MNEFLKENREIVADRLVMLARQIYSGMDCDCFIMGDFSVSLHVEPINYFEPQRLEPPNESE